MTTKRGLKSPVLENLKKSGKTEAGPTGGKQFVVRPNVIRVFTSNIGLPVHLADFVEATGGAGAGSIRGAVRDLLQEGKLNIEVIEAGHTWVYRGLHEDTVKEAEAAPVRPVGSKQLYTELGTAKDGTKVLEDEEGKLWRATEL